MAWPSSAGCGAGGGSKLRRDRPQDAPDLRPAGTPLQTGHRDGERHQHPVRHAPLTVLVFHAQDREDAASQPNARASGHVRWRSTCPPRRAIPARDRPSPLKAAGRPQGARPRCGLRQSGRRLADGRRPVRRWARRSGGTRGCHSAGPSMTSLAIIGSSPSRGLAAAMSCCARAMRALSCSSTRVSFVSRATR